VKKNSFNFTFFNSSKGKVVQKKDLHVVTKMIEERDGLGHLVTLSWLLPL
jgi:hypothetical protein